MLLGSLGIADSTRFVESLQKTRQGADVPIVPLMRTLGIELWLRNLTTRHVLGDDAWQTQAATKQALPQTDDVSPIASNSVIKPMSSQWLSREDKPKSQLRNSKGKGGENQ